MSLGALGVVYGDIGTSPLYTVQLLFSGDHPMAPSPVRVYGALSLIFWALMLIVTLKYVLLILRVDNHGEGGIMALVALIERVVKTRRKTGLVIVGVLGASLFYGDGMLTPAISVVSAVSGLQVASPALASQIVPFSLAILIGLFALQRFGTGAVGGLFGPIMVVWFLVHRRPRARRRSRRIPASSGRSRRPTPGSSWPTTRRWGSSPSDRSSWR